MSEWWPWAQALNCEHCVWQPILAATTSPSDLLGVTPGENLIVPKEEYSHWAYTELAHRGFKRIELVVNSYSLRNFA